MQSNNSYENKKVRYDEYFAVPDRAKLASVRGGYRHGGLVLYLGWPRVNAFYSNNKQYLEELFLLGKLR